MTEAAEAALARITTVLFDFAGVLTSSPWGAIAGAGGGDLELLIGPYDEDTDHPWHRLERGEMAIVDWAAERHATRRARRGVEVDFAPLGAMLGEMAVHEPGRRTGPAAPRRGLPASG